MRSIQLEKVISIHLNITTTTISETPRRSKLIVIEVVLSTIPAKESQIAKPLIIIAKIAYYPDQY